MGQQDHVGHLHGILGKKFIAIQRQFSYLETFEFYEKYTCMSLPRRRESSDEDVFNPILSPGIPHEKSMQTKGYPSARQVRI